MKIIFAGTPEFSVIPLIKLLDAKHEICAVLTQPDRPAGRGRKIQTSSIKKIAQENNLNILQPENLKDPQLVDVLKSYQADLMVVVAYGIIIPPTILDLPKYGCFNIHASILPKWRGAAPIHRAIQNNDQVTGVSIMQMDAGLDTGDILLIKKIAIDPTDNTASLHDKLSDLGAKALLETIDLTIENKLQPKKQDNSLSTYAHKILKSEALINWSESTTNIINLIRAFNPWPVAQTNLHNKTIRIWEAVADYTATNNPPGTIIKLNSDSMDIATKDGVIKITKLQLSGKKAMHIKDFCNSNHNIVINTDKLT